MPNQARFLDFMDMVDGGGAGRMGDKFEGGGVFSALANMMATPYGSEDEERRKRREEAYRAAGLLQMETPKEATVIRTGDRRPTPTKPSPQQLAEARMAELERQRGLEQDVFDPRGPNQMGASGFRNPTESYPNMSMPAIAGYTTPAPEYRSMDQAVGGLRNRNMGADPYAPVGSSNPAVQAEIARRQEMQRMMQYEPLGEGVFGTVEDVRFGPRAERAEPTSLLDTRQQVPQPDEARALQAIADNNMMPDFINLPPYQQRAMITAMLERGY